MIKKQYALFLCSLMTGAILMTGCGSKESTAQTTEAVSETVQAEAASETQTASETETESETETASETETNSQAETASQEETETDMDTAQLDPVSDDSQNQAAAKTSDVVSIAGWKITVEDVQINPSLENVSVELGYTGVETTDYVKEASEGHTFCLVKMLIEKDGSKEVIDWSSMKLTDKNGTQYSRLEDEFITDLGMMRMPGTTLNFGSSEGWIAFEIEEGAEELVLCYPFEEETYSCSLQ